MNDTPVKVAANSMPAWAMKILPVEWITYLGILAALAGVLLGNLPFLSPGILAVFVFIIHMMPLFLLCFVIASVSKNPAIEKPAGVARCYGALFVASYLCLLFKNWSHLLSPVYYDELYHRWDGWFAPMITLERRFNDWLGLPVSVRAYLDVFQLVYYVAFPVCFMGGARLFRAMSCAYAANLVIGGLSYCIAPALGPFIYTPRPEWHPLIKQYMDATSAFRESHGAAYQPGNFLYSLGAMPSAHVSIPLIFTWYMGKVHKLWGAVGLAVTTYCFMEAKFTGFHYYVDLLAGIVLAVVCIVVSERFMHFCGVDGRT